MLRDLVEQQTTTTGTGSYTVSGSVAGRQPFSAFLSNRSNLSYVVTDDAGNFECGYGNWNQGAGTLSRSAIIASSNANAAVDWAAGTKRIFLADHSGSRQFAARHNADDSSMLGYISGYPTASHNQSMGFDRGSVWHGLNRRLSCLSIDTFTGDAKWMLDVQSEWIGIDQNGGGRTVFFGCLLDGHGYQHSKRGASFAAAQSSGGSVPGSSAFYMGVADAGIFPLCAMTTDATPTSMGVDVFNTSGFAGAINTPGCATVTGSISAFDSLTGDVKSWKIEGVFKCDSGYVVSVAAGGSPSVIYGDASLAAATCALEAGPSGDGTFSIQVTGIAGKTIRWAAAVVFSIVGDGN